MKLIIEIDKKTYGCVKEGIDFDDPQVLRRAIRNGTPIPDNATNGDVQKTVFPNEYWQMDEGQTTDGTNIFMDSWLNAPYQKGGKE